jgi:YidC/Oxa1 family membrane protein insertase
MKIKEFILPLVFAFAGTLLIHYFFLPDKKAVVEDTADRRFVAPTTLQVSEPLDLDIDYYDAAPSRAQENSVVSLPMSRIQFSNDGAVVNFIGYARDLGGKQTLIETLTPTPGTRKGSFLVALDGVGKTPYYYSLVERKEQGDTTVLTYKGESPAATITKQFVVHHAQYVIDLVVTIDPKLKEGVRPRIFYDGPRVLGDVKDVAQAVLASGNSLEKKAVKDLVNVGVERPTIFGLEDTYFAQVLYKDPESFAQRAYFKVEGDTSQAVLQSNLINEKKSWTLSFYVGPKELVALSHVDSRLEGLLSYGWFFYISKYLLFVLIFLYGIFKNYGIAIIVLTILTRILLVPFTLRAEETKKRNTEAQKKLQYLEQRYKNDPDALMAAKAELMRKHGIPGALGCLPVLFQAPVFLGLQRVLSNAIELYQAPFLWISDLSSPDPYYILPIVAGASPNDGESDDSPCGLRSYR